MDSVPVSPSSGSSDDSGPCDNVEHLRIEYEAMKRMDFELRKVQEQWLKTAQNLLIHIHHSASASADARLQDSLAFESELTSVDVDVTASKVSRMSARVSNKATNVTLASDVIGATSEATQSRGLAFCNTECSELPTSASQQDHVHKLAVIQTERKQAVQKLRSSKPEDPQPTSGSGSAGLWQVVCMARSICKKVEVHPAFRILVFASISTNVIATGVELDYLARSPDLRGESETFDMIQIAYTVFFCIELLIRLISHGRFFFTDERELAWNVFDLVIVGASLVETFASKHADMAQFRSIRVMRATRFMRGVRIFRILRFIQALRGLAMSIMMSLPQVLWSTTLLVIIVFSFSVAFVQAVTDHCSQSKSFRSDLVASGCADANLAKFWGTIPRAMLTLFMSITGGVSWIEPADVLGLISPIWLLMFLSYVTFTALAVLNVVTAAFCQSAMASVQFDRDQVTMQLLSDKGSYHHAFDKLFEDMDTDRSGMITFHEFEQALQQDDVNAYLESLHMSMEDAWQLFKILDADNSGSIDKDEFIMGCIQLKGGAKAVDIARMAYDNKMTQHILDATLKRIEEEISKLHVHVVSSISELRRSSSSTPNPLLEDISFKNLSLLL